MKRRIRVKKTETFDKRDLALLSGRETTALADGYMVNISENVAREMITKGWVINIDPMKPITRPRTVADVVRANPGLAANVPGIETKDEADGNEGTTDDVPREGPYEEVQPDAGAGDCDEGREAEVGAEKPVNPGLS